MQAYLSEVMLELEAAMSKSSFVFEEITTNGRCCEDQQVVLRLFVDKQRSARLRDSEDRATKRCEAVQNRQRNWIL